MVKINPNSPCSPEILSHILPIEVKYFDFDGNEKTSQIEVNETVLTDVKDFFALAYRLKFPINRVTKSSDPEFNWDDNKIMTANASTAFNYRKIAGSNRLSLHSIGLAFDINPVQNPYLKYKDGQITAFEPDGSKYNSLAPGTLTSDHSLVQFMISRGWEWGGNWLPESGRIDYQHFQKI